MWLLFVAFAIVCLMYRLIVRVSLFLCDVLFLLVLCYVFGFALSAAFVCDCCVCSFIYIFVCFRVLCLLFLFVF